MIRRNNDGFTLIEILVTVALIAIMAGLLLPNLPDITGSKLKSTSRKLASTISYMYDRSAAAQLTLRLTIDIKENSYSIWLLNQNNKFEPTELTFAKEGKLSSSIEFRDIRTMSQGLLSDGEAYIHFFPGGYAEQSVIHLTDLSGGETTLVVHPLTGRVAILEGYVDARNGA